MISGAGLFIYPWDFMDEGADEVVAIALDLGVTHVMVASVYHAGFFLYPHNPRHKTQLLEDGVAYFHPDPDRYRDGPIRPRIASICTDKDWFSEICDRSVAAGLRVGAWTVVCHNTPLGLAHPKATIHNAFGDIYPHALSPGHPDTVAYSCALVDDLADRYPLDLIFLEAIDYRRRRHGADWVAGHHHERDGTHLRPLESFLMDLSFNPADVDRAETTGIDVARLRDLVTRHLQRYFDAAPDIPEELPATVAEFRDRHAAFGPYCETLAEAESAMAAALRDIAHARGVRLMGSARPELDVVVLSAYGMAARDIEETTKRAKSHLLDHQQLAVLIRMGFSGSGRDTPITTELQMTEVTQAADRGGADVIGYYNYGEAPRRSVQWIKPALERIGLARPAGA